MDFYVSSSVEDPNFLQAHEAARGPKNQWAGLK
jgi:hypothetical protein